MGLRTVLKDKLPNGSTNLRLNGPKLQAYVVLGTAAVSVKFVVQVSQFCSLHKTQGGLRYTRSVDRCRERTLLTLKWAAVQS